MTSESSFVKLVKSIKIKDLEKEIKEDNGTTTSMLEKIKKYERYLVNMAKDGTKTENIISFVMDPRYIGLTDKIGTQLFVTRLLTVYSIQSQSHSM